MQSKTKNQQQRVHPMKSVFSDNEVIKKFESEVLNELNANLRDLRINASPRTVGDAAQDVIETYFADKLPTYMGQSINEKFARRAMADVAFTDVHGNYVIVDVKTHNEETAFNMPNLTSVERLSRFYQDDSNYFSLLIAKYNLENGEPKFDKVIFIPIEYLDWSCLTIGALGWGQIQIANAKIINVNYKQTRKEWMLKLCDALDLFYPNEIEKINNRIAHFKSIRAFWENK